MWTKKRFKRNEKSYCFLHIYMFWGAGCPGEAKTLHKRSHRFLYKDQLDCGICWIVLLFFMHRVFTKTRGVSRLRASVCCFVCCLLPTTFSEATDSAKLQFMVLTILTFQNVYWYIRNTDFPVILCWNFSLPFRPKTPPTTPRALFWQIIFGGPKWKPLMFVLFRAYNNSKCVQPEQSN